jgi:hypothetical protein
MPLTVLAALLVVGAVLVLLVRERRAPAQAGEVPPPAVEAAPG